MTENQRRLENGLPVTDLPHYFVQEADEPVATCIHCRCIDQGDEFPNCPGYLCPDCNGEGTWYSMDHTGSEHPNPCVKCNETGFRGPLSDEPREHILKVELGEFTRYHLTCNLDDSAACHQCCATHPEGGCAEKHLDPDIDQAPCVQEVYRNGCVIAEWVNDGGIESVGFDHTVELPVTYYWDGAHDFPILSVLQRILSGAAE
jgi:hypothetical protein